MKLLYKILLLCAALLFNMAVQAQDLRNNKALQERLTQAKLLEIQKGLKLDEAQLKALTPIYKRYDKERNEIHFSRQSNRQALLLRLNPDSLSTEEADKIISTQLDDAVKISTFRRKYYHEFRAVLTPQQIMELYKSEAQIRRKVMQEFRMRFGNNRLR